MDTATIDQAYGQLQGEFANVARSVQDLANKLQAAAQAGNTDAKEWLLDLKQIALDVKGEQVQVNTLLQAIHSYVDNSNQQFQQIPQYQQVQQFPQYQQVQRGGLFGGGGGGGLFGNFLGGGFGQAIEMGAGIGLGEEIIDGIF